MKFARLEMLFLIWALPLLLLVFIYGMRRRRLILSRFAPQGGYDSVNAEMDGKRRWIKALLVLLSLLFVVLSLSGPQYGFKWENVEQKGIDMIIAMDCSKSMLAEDIKPSRLDRAKREVTDLLGMLKGDRVGLVAFAGTAFLQCPLTIDYEAFHLFLKYAVAGFFTGGGERTSPRPLKPPWRGLIPKATRKKRLFSLPTVRIREMTHLRQWKKQPTKTLKFSRSV